MLSGVFFYSLSASFFALLDGISAGISKGLAARAICARLFCGSYMKNNVLPAFSPRAFLMFLGKVMRFLSSILTSTSFVSAMSYPLVENSHSSNNLVITYNRYYLSRLFGSLFSTFSHLSISFYRASNFKSCF